MSIYFVLALTLLNATAAQAARVILPLYALELDANALTIGILGATFSVLPLLLSVPVGRLADRFGSRWPLIFAAIGGGLGMLIPYFFATLPAIFVAASISGLSFGIYFVNTQNLVGQLSNLDTRVKNFSNYSTAAAVGNLLGPLIAGFSIEHSGYTATCLYVAVLTVAPIAMLSMRGGVLPKGGGKSTAAKGGIRSLLLEPGVKKTITAGGLLFAGQDLYKTYMPVYGHAIGLSPSLIGIVLSMFAAAGFVVRLFLQYLIARFNEEKLLAYSFYVTAVCLMLIPLFKSAVMLGLVSFILGLGMGCSQPIITMLMFSNSPKGRSGEAMGLRMMVVHVTRISGPVVFGVVGFAFGLPPMFWMNALLMGAGGILSQPKR